MVEVEVPYFVMNLIAVNGTHQNIGHIWSRVVSFKQREGKLICLEDLVMWLVHRSINIMSCDREKWVTRLGSPSIESHRHFASNTLITNLEFNTSIQWSTYQKTFLDFLLHSFSSRDDCFAKSVTVSYFHFVWSKDGFWRERTTYRSSIGNTQEHVRCVGKDREVWECVFVTSSTETNKQLFTDLTSSNWGYQLPLLGKSIY